MNLNRIWILAIILMVFSPFLTHAGKIQKPSVNHDEDVMVNLLLTLPKAKNETLISAYRDKKSVSKMSDEEVVNEINVARKKIQSTIIKSTINSLESVLINKPSEYNKFPVKNTLKKLANLENLFTEEQIKHFNITGEIIKLYHGPKHNNEIAAIINTMNSGKVTDQQNMLFNKSLEYQDELWLNELGELRKLNSCAQLFSIGSDIDILGSMRGLGMTAKYLTDNGVGAVNLLKKDLLTMQEKRYEEELQKEEWAEKNFAKYANSEIELLSKKIDLVNQKLNRFLNGLNSFLIDRNGDSINYYEAIICNLGIDRRAPGAKEKNKTAFTHLEKLSELFSEEEIDKNEHDSLVSFEEERHTSNVFESFERTSTYHKKVNKINLHDASLMTAMALIFGVKDMYDKTNIDIGRNEINKIYAKLQGKCAVKKEMPPQLNALTKQRAKLLIAIGSFKANLVRAFFRASASSPHTIDIDKMDSRDLGKSDTEGLFNNLGNNKGIIKHFSNENDPLGFYSKHKVSIRNMHEKAYDIGGVRRATLSQIFETFFNKDLFFDTQGHRLYLPYNLEDIFHNDAMLVRLLAINMTLSEKPGDFGNHKLAFASYKKFTENLPENLSKLYSSNEHMQKRTDIKNALVDKAKEHNETVKIDELNFQERVDLANKLGVFGEDDKKKFYHDYVENECIKFINNKDAKDAVKGRFVNEYRDAYAAFGTSLLVGISSLLPLSVPLPRLFFAAILNQLPKETNDNFWDWVALLDDYDSELADNFRKNIVGNQSIPDIKVLHRNLLIAEGLDEDSNDNEEDLDDSEKEFRKWVNQIDKNNWRRELITYIQNKYLKLRSSEGKHFVDTFHAIRSGFLGPQNLRPFQTKDTKTVTTDLINLFYQIHNSGKDKTYNLSDLFKTFNDNNISKFGAFSLLNWLSPDDFVESVFTGKINPEELVTKIDRTDSYGLQNKEEQETAGLYLAALKEYLLANKAADQGKRSQETYEKEEDAKQRRLLNFVAAMSGAKGYDGRRFKIEFKRESKKSAHLFFHTCFSEVEITVPHKLRKQLNNDEEFKKHVKEIIEASFMPSKFTSL